jgi:meso-butanediol dehydrogenase/(S,S)-butanediol dehydrogenase/diacetyl reductase
MSVSPISTVTRSLRSRQSNLASAEASGGKVTHASVDVTDRMQVRAMIAHAVSVFGKLDVKFNNAGVNKPMNFLDVTEENWNFIMGVNGLGCLIGMQEAARQMIAQGTGGKIINTASIASRQGFDNVAPYCASKFAVVSLTQSGARDLAKHNITVTGFAPGVVATEMWEQVDQDLMEIGAAERPGQAMEEFSAEILKGRVAVPRDITGTTTFLASADSDYMTGQIVMIDGGMTCWSEQGFAKAAACLSRCGHFRMGGRKRWLVVSVGRILAGSSPSRAS